MNEAVFRDEVDDAMLFGHLYSHREVIWGLGGEENVHSLFCEHGWQGCDQFPMCG